jgi:hypothetical protein
MTTEQPPERTDSHNEGAGASGVADLDRAAILATRLAEFGGLSVADATAEFTRLLAYKGPTVYLQVAASAPGATLTLLRQDGVRAMLCVPNGFCCGAGPGATPPGASIVMVLWCRSTIHKQFEATCPSSTRRISLIINGRLHEVAPEELPLTYDLITA